MSKQETRKPLKLVGVSDTRKPLQLVGVKKKDEESEPSLQKQYEESQSTVQEPNLESVTKTTKQDTSLGLQSPTNNESYDLKTQAKTPDFTEPFSVEKQGDLPNKIQKHKEDVGVWKDLTNRFKSGGLTALAGVAGVDNFINKLSASIVLDKESLAELNKLPKEAREILLASGSPEQISRIQNSAEAQNFLTDKAEKLSEKTIQYEGNIVDDIGNGDFGKASYRVIQGAVESLPSMILALSPGGLATIGASTAAQKQETQDREGADLGLKTVANSVINGTAEAFFEKYTQGIFEPIKKMALGNKEIAKEISENLVKTILKDIGIEGGSEGLTSITQDLSDKLVAGKDVSMLQILKNSIDASIIGGFVGGSMSGVKGYVSTKTRSSETTKKINENSAMSEALKKELNIVDSESIKNALQAKIEQVDSETAEIQKAELAKLDNLSDEQVKEVFEVDGEMKKVNQSFIDLVNDDKMSPEVKKVLEKDLEQKFTELEAKKNEIVNPKVEEIAKPITEKNAEVAETKPIENAEIVPEKVEVAKPNEVAQNDIKANEEISPIEKGNIVYHGTDVEGKLKVGDWKESEGGAWFSSTKEGTIPYGDKIVESNLEGLNIKDISDKTKQEATIDYLIRTRQAQDFSEAKDIITKEDTWRKAYKGLAKELELFGFDGAKFKGELTNANDIWVLPDSVEKIKSQKNQIAPIKENKDENPQNNDITPNGNIQLGIDKNKQQGEDKNIQKSVEPKSDKNDVEVRKVKSLKGATYDVSFDANGNVTKIISPKDGREVPKFIERKLKPTKKNLKEHPTLKKLVLNGNYAKIESDALGTITNNMANDERKAKVSNALDKFTPTDEYSHALQFFAQGGAVNLESAKKETRLSAKEVKWASRSENKYKKDSELKTIEATAEDIVANSSQDLDIQEVRNALIDLISNKEGSNNVENEVVGIVESEKKAIEEEELFAYLGGLSKKDLSLYESIKAEDDYISELTDKEVEYYYNSKINEYEQAENGKQAEQIKEGGNAIVEGNEGKKPTTNREKIDQKKKIKFDNIDDYFAKLKEALPGIKDEDLKGNGFTQDQLLDLMAKSVKFLVGTGIEVNEAIKQVVASIKEKLDIDINPDDVKAKLNGEKPKVEPKKVEPKVKKPKSENKGLDGFRDKIKELPNSGEFSKYLSGETIERVEGTEIRNNQSIEVMILTEAGEHGLQTIEMAKDIFGAEYVEKTIEYLDDANLKSHEKALIYVSLENDMANRIMANPESLGEQKLQDLVRAKSQQHLREASLSINAGRLRAIMRDKYIADPITNQMYSPEQLTSKNKIQKAIESNMDALNNEAELQESEPDFEIKPPKIIRSAKVVKLEIAETLKKMRADLLRVAKGDMALASIPYAAQLKAATPHIIKLSKLLAELGGMKTRAIINEIHNQIKDTFTDVSKQDISDILKAKNTPKQKVKVDNKAREAKEFVKQALIEQGFGREINVTVNDKDAQGNNILDENGRNKKVKQKRNVLDWKKLAGQEGSIEKIRKNVQEVLKSKGYTDTEIESMSKEYEAEYNDLRASVIEKSLNELERRNTVKKKVDIKSSAKRLAELFNYGLFEKEADTYNNLINSALGFNDFDNASFKELEVLAKSLAQLYATGKTEIELNSAITDINKKISRAVSNAGFLQSSTPYKITAIVTEFINLNTRFLLVRLGQLIENPFSGYAQRAYTKLSYAFEGTDNKKLSDQRRKVSKKRFKSIVRDGGNAYGDTSSLLINESVLENWLNNSTNSEINHALISFYMGRAFLEGYDSRHKTVLTEGYFQYNLIKVLTSPSNPNRMSKEDALAFVTESLTGKSFEDAKKEAREITEQTNRDAGKKILSEKERAIEILAQDIMKGYLLKNSLMTIKEVEASYNAAYKAAGKDIGHVANNPLSQMVGWLSTNTQKRLDEAKKQKKWGEAALYTAELMFTRNIMNTFVGGGTNWVVLQLQKAGPTGLVSTAYTRILKGNEKIDTTTELGIKNLEKVMFNDLNYKNTSARLIIGSLLALVTASAFIGSGADDDLNEWLKKNKWARKYFDKLAPEVLVLILANKNDEMGKYWMHIVNNKLNIYDNSYKVGKAMEDLFSKEGAKTGSTGLLLGSKLNTPAPTGFANDIRNIYRGVTEKPDIKPEYKASGFLNGYFQGGLIEFIGLRPGEKQSDIDIRKKMEGYASPSVKKTKEEKEETKERQLERIEEDYKRVLEYNLRHPNNPIKHVLPKSLQKSPPPNPNGQKGGQGGGQTGGQSGGQK